MNLSRAYNQSIYLMLVVPYTMLGVVGYMVYLQLRARAALMEASLHPGPEPLNRAPGVNACQTTPPAENS